MSEFPKWMGPKGGDPIWCRSAGEAQEDWVEHFGHYDTMIGQFVRDQQVSPMDDINALRAEYRGRFGKNPGPRWDAATLRNKLA